MGRERLESQRRAGGGERRPHLGSGLEACAALGRTGCHEELRQLRVEIATELSGITWLNVDGRSSVGLGVLTVAQELVQGDAGIEQVGGDIPACEVCIRRLVRRCAGDRLHGITNPRGDVEVQQLGP